MRKKPYKRGFSIVEVMVSVSILLLLTGAVSTNMANVREAKQYRDDVLLLEKAAEAVTRAQHDAAAETFDPDSWFSEQNVKAIVENLKKRSPEAARITVTSFGRALVLDASSSSDAEAAASAARSYEAANKKRYKPTKVVLLR